MACGAAAFVFRNELQGYVTENAANLMRTYNESIDGYIRDAWDAMHGKLVGVLLLSVLKQNNNDNIKA